MADDADMVIDFPNHSVIVPGAMAENVPIATEVAWGYRPVDRATVLAVVTDEPTAEEIASKGREVVASMAVLLDGQSMRSSSRG